MDNIYDERRERGEADDDLRLDLDAWFLVSGDTDDFIFFGEDDRPHSEK